MSGGIVGLDVISRVSERDTESNNTTTKFRVNVELLKQLVNKAREIYDKKVIKANQVDQKLRKIINNKLGKNHEKGKGVKYVE